MAEDAGATTGDDGRRRCPWGDSPAIYRAYHDEEWGREVHGRDALFERLCLEAFQAGLSWITVLRKREAFRAAFAGFDPDRVAAFDAADIDRLMGDAGIIRNRSKIQACIANAGVVLKVDDLDGLLWSFAPISAPPRPRTATGIPAVTGESVALAKALKKLGMRFVGPTTAYALMQATGMVDDHLTECWRAGR